MENKWYSHKLKTEEIATLEKKYAKIVKPFYGILNDRNLLGLEFDLSYDNGSRTTCSLTNDKDIRELLLRTNSKKISNLEGFVIEAFVKKSNDQSYLQSISVNEHLI